MLTFLVNIDDDIVSWHRYGVIWCDV